MSPGDVIRALGVSEPNSALQEEVDRRVRQATEVIQGLLRQHKGTTVPLARQLYEETHTGMVDMALSLRHGPVDSARVLRNGALVSGVFIKSGRVLGVECAPAVPYGETLRYGGGILRRAAGMDESRYVARYYAGYAIGMHEDWESDKSYEVGDWVEGPEDLHLLCVAGGVSAANRPAWPAVPGKVGEEDLGAEADPSKVVDGSVTWQAWRAHRLPDAYVEAAHELAMHWQKYGFRSSVQAVRKGGLQVTLRSGAHAAVPDRILGILGISDG